MKTQSLNSYNIIKYYDEKGTEDNNESLEEQKYKSKVSNDTEGFYYKRRRLCGDKESKMNWRKWTEEEIKILRENYPNMESKELVSLLKGRDVWSIRIKAHKEGLLKKPEVKQIYYDRLGKQSSMRMKLNNPMKNKETIEKMRKTKKRQLKSCRDNTNDEFKGCIRLKKLPFTEEQKRFVIEMYRKGFPLSYIGEALGFSTNTIKRRMIYWGIPRRTEHRYSGFHKSDDGHIVKSSMELITDNWLFHNGILHIYEKRLGETRFLCDFYIPNVNIYIEVFGLTDKKYKERFNRKLKVYEEMGLIDKLVIILPRDRVGEKLRFLLSESKIQRRIEDYDI